jgi:hypothetical protein
MGTKTIRLDEETEQILQQIIQSTGLSISGALKKGLHVLHREIDQHIHRTPYDVYRELDLGPGGYAIAPSTQTRQGVKKALRKKHCR